MRPAHIVGCGRLKCTSLLSIGEGTCDTRVCSRFASEACEVSSGTGRKRGGLRHKSDQLRLPAANDVEARSFLLLSTTTRHRPAPSPYHIAAQHAAISRCSEQLMPRAGCPARPEAPMAPAANMAASGSMFGLQHENRDTSLMICAENLRRRSIAR